MGEPRFGWHEGCVEGTAEPGEVPRAAEPGEVPRTGSEEADAARLAYICGEKDSPRGPQDAAPEEAVPDGAAPEEAVPDGAAPEEAVPEGAVPDGAAPAAANGPSGDAPGRASPQGEYSSCRSGVSPAPADSADAHGSPAELGAVVVQLASDSASGEAAGANSAGPSASPSGSPEAARGESPPRGGAPGSSGRSPRNAAGSPSEARSESLPPADPACSSVSPPPPGTRPGLESPGYDGGDDESFSSRSLQHSTDNKRAPEGPCPPPGASPAAGPAPPAEPSALRRWARHPQGCALPYTLEYCELDKRTKPRPPIYPDREPSDISSEEEEMVYPSVLQVRRRQAAARAGLRSRPAEACRPFGACGLYNLGNTCYMNAALQCLSNLPRLRDFFRSGQYVSDLNTVNPIGCKGMLAQSFGALVRAMWSGEYSMLPPRHIKKTVGHFSPMEAAGRRAFAGYDQCDAHEFLNWFLDGLHEDLNKVKDKKYHAEQEDLGQLPDEENAAKSWARHLERNQSMVQDLFTSQMRSRMRCNICQHEQSVFEPSTCVEISLRRKEDVCTVQHVVVVPADPAENFLHCAVVVRRDCSIAQLKRAVAEALQQDGRECDKRALYCSQIEHERRRGFSAPMWRVLDPPSDESTLNELPAIPYGVNGHVCMWEVPELIPRDDPGLECIAAAAAALAVLAAAWEGSDVLLAGTTVEIVGIVKRPELNGTLAEVTEKTQGDRIGVLHKQGQTLALRRENLKRWVPEGQREVKPRKAEPEENRQCVLRVAHRGKILAVDGRDPVPRLTEVTFPTVTVLAAGATDRELFEAIHRALPPPEFREPSEQSSDESDDSELKAARRSRRDSAAADVIDGLRWNPDAPCHFRLAFPLYQNHRGERFELEYNPETSAEEHVLQNLFDTAIRDQRDPYTRKRREADYAAPKAFNIIALWDPAPPEYVTFLRPKPVVAGHAAWERAHNLEEARRRMKQGELTLEQCLAHHTMEEQLDDMQMWRCPKCKEPVNAYKQLSFWTPPEHLVILLKRFSHNARLPPQLAAFGQRKVTMHVDYPIDGLDLAPYMARRATSPLTYDLACVALHTGNMHGGHYVAMARNDHTGQWMHFDDESVKLAEPDEIVDPDAYILCYQRRPEGACVSPTRSMARETASPRSMHSPRSLDLSPARRRDRF